MAHRLIIASNRLPVSVREEHGTLSLSRSNGGLATALSSLFNQNESVWVGWTGLRRHLSVHELSQLHLPSYLHPINLTDREITGYYDEFSNGILWPLVHGLPATTPFSPPLLHEAKSVTKKFADIIEQTCKPEDSIWIHDYHLMLLPGELRRRGLKNRIGFFLHTPYMPVSHTQQLPCMGELLESLLASNVIGFQTKPDVARFIEACHHFRLPLPPQLLIKPFPIGIDFEEFDALNDTPTMQKRVLELKKQFPSPTIIFSLSRLDYTKGILTQLKAFEALINRIPEPEKVTYRLNVAPSRESVLEYRDLKNSIEQLVADINKDAHASSWQPVVYSYENIGLEEIVAWYQVADIHLNLPIADGMNLVVKEYIAARREPGVPIITSTMGAALQLKEALIVPPESVEAATKALQQALDMLASEKAARWHALRHNVKTHQVTEWARDFLAALTK